MTDFPAAARSGRPTGPATMTSPLGDGLAFRSMSGIEGLSTLFAFDVEATSARSDIEADELLGQAVTIHLDLGLPDRSVRHWSGRVSQLEYVETGNDGLSRYRITLRPWLWHLGLNADCRIFQNLSVPDIVEQVFRDRQFSDFEQNLAATYEAYEYIVQYRESDLEFVSRLLEREGIYYFFRHTDGKHTLVLADNPLAHHPVQGYAALPYAVRDPHRDQTMEYVRLWRAESRIESGRRTLADFDFTKPRVNLCVSDSTDDESDVDVYDYPGGFNSFPGGSRVARVRLEQDRREGKTWVGETNARGMSVGAIFRLEDHPRDDQNGSYLVAFSRTRLRATDAASGNADAEEPCTCSFRARSRDAQFRPPLRRYKPVGGPQTAIVVGPEGQEIWTDQYGRVKVQFHWDREGQNDQRSSCWVRVSQAWAGSGWGAQFIPRMGDEVIVDFLEGDPDRPIITGTVYNGAHMPPFPLPGNQTQSGIRTRSTPGGNQFNGNEIRFEDRKGAEDLFIQAEKTQTTVVKDNQSVTVGSNRSVRVEQNLIEFVGAVQTETVGLARAVFVGAQDSLTVVGDTVRDLRGNRTVTVAGDAKESVTGDVIRSHGADLREMTTGNGTSSFGGDYTATHGGDRHVVVGAAGAPKLATLSVNGNAEAYIGQDVRLETTSSFTLRCGDSEIVVTPQEIRMYSPKLTLASKALDASAKTVSVEATDSYALSAKTLTAQTSGGKLVLDDSSASLLGTQVKLGKGSGSGPSSAEVQPEPTVLHLTRHYHDDRPVQGAEFTVKLESGGTVQGKLDATGKASLPLTSKPTAVKFGPDARPWARVKIKNPHYQERFDADAFVQARWSGRAGASDGQDDVDP